jgi:hypothetical protein
MAPAPKPSKPPDLWAVLPAPTIGDPSEEITFTSVGRALTNWEFFEVQLAKVFAALIGADDPFPAHLAYGSVLAFNGRSKLISASAEAFFASHPNINLLEGATKILKNADRAAARRNEIAHGMVSPYYSRMQRRVKLGFALIPPNYARNKNILTPAQDSESRFTMMPKFVYSSKEIDTSGKRFREMARPVFRASSLFRVR